MPNRYLIYLNNQQNFFPSDRKKVLSILNPISISVQNVEIRDVRISSYFIELDISMNDDMESEIQNIFVKHVQNCSLLYLEQLNEEKSKLSVIDTVISGVYLFNVERYWKSHEVLENVWKNSVGITKDFLNGLILVDAAFVHLQRNEHDIFFSILGRAYQKLEKISGIYHQINVDDLKRDIHTLMLNRIPAKFKIIVK